MIDAVRRVGHKGADLIEPGNTLASFDAALTHGVDMIELDVLPARGREDALSAHWRLVSRSLVSAVREAGGELYVWTVDHAPRIRELEELGVTGVITNDPRLFG